MKKFTSLIVLAALAGCQQQVSVPTAKQLVDNAPLRAEWQAKCNTGEYSHLEAAQRASLCSTTDQATATVAQIKASKADSDFFNAASKRK